MATNVFTLSVSYIQYIHCIGINFVTLKFIQELPMIIGKRHTL